MQDLFADDRRDSVLAPGAMVLGGFALPEESAILSALQTIITQAPFRHMVTPGGHTMSVGMTNCGEVGWVSDAKGYRYTANDPLTNKAWPSLPNVFLKLAIKAGERAGFPNFMPTACLINRYIPGAKLSLHQDKDEQDLGAPIVSVSLGLPATFLFGGLNRNDPKQKILLQHGDVVVWGGSSRLFYHAINPLKRWRASTVRKDAY